MPVLPHARCRDHHHHASTDITQMVVTCEHVITYTPWCSVTVVAARGQPARRNAIAGTMDEDADRSALS